METEIGSQKLAKNPSLICAPVMGDSVEEMVIETCKAQELGADLVEIRLDSLKEFNPLEDLKIIIQKSPLPTLFTYRFVYVCACLCVCVLKLETFIVSDMELLVSATVELLMTDAAFLSSKVMG